MSKSKKKDGELRRLSARAKRLETQLRSYDRMIAMLDEALATPMQVAQRTDDEGVFVSTLDLTETGEEIIHRAIVRIKNSNLEE